MRKKLFSIVLAMLTVITCITFASCAQAERPKKYTVTFDSVGGSAVPTQSVDEGKFITEPEAPTKADDTFLYWYLDNKTFVFDFDNYVVSSKITLKARWQSDVKTYTVTFDSVGGSAIASQEVEDYKLIEEPQPPTKAGDTFVYWYLDRQSNNIDFETYKPKADITLKAHWESDPVLYLISYKIGDELYTTQEIGRDGYYATKPQNPTKEGMIFAYWHLEGKSEPFIFDENEIKKHITLKATFLVGDIEDGNIKFYLGTETGNTMINGFDASKQNITASAGDTISLPKLSTHGNFAKFRGWINATTGEKYLVENYQTSNYSFVYDGTALLMYAIWE